MVRNFQIDGCTNLKYYRWQGTYDGFSIDNKIIDAYKLFSAEYEYIWMHKDGLVINADVIYKAIKEPLRQSKEIIVVNANWRDIKNIGSKQYNDVQMLFKEQCMQMTILGATIIKSSVVMDIINTVPLKKGETYGMWQPIAFFKYYAYKKIAAQSIVDNIWIGNPTVCNICNNSKNTIKLWVDLWVDLIKNLPDYYDNEKENALKVIMSDFHPFYALNLLKLRAGGGLRYEDVNKYKNNIKKVTETSIYKFYIISIIPVIFAKYLVKNEDSFFMKFIKACYYVICGIVPGEKEILE